MASDRQETQVSDSQVRSNIVKQVTELRYLGDIITSDGNIVKDIKRLKAEEKTAYNILKKKKTCG